MSGRSDDHQGTGGGTGATDPSDGTNGNEPDSGDPGDTEGNRPDRTHSSEAEEPVSFATVGAALDGFDEPCLVVDGDLRVRHANDALGRIVGDSGDAVEALADRAGPGFRRRCRRALDVGEPAQLDATVVAGGDRYEVRLSPVEDGLWIRLIPVGDAPGAVAADAPGRVAADEGEGRGLGELAAVISAGDLGFEEKVRRLLAIGRDRLGVADGLLTRVDERTDELEVVETSPDPTVVDPGERLPLESLYCRSTVSAEGLVRVPNAVGSEWENDPAHADFGVACYLGGRVDVNGDRYGTVCFVDDAGRGRPFSESECRFVELLVGWLGGELERRRREHRLERYETIVETVEDGIYALDGDCRFTVVNEGLTGMTGYDREALLGAEGSLLFPGGIDDGELRSVAGDPDRSVATTVETADGDRITVENTVARFPTAEGDPGWVGVARDVTDRVERRRRLRELQRVSRELTRATNEAEVCDAAARAATEVLDVDRSGLVRVDDEEGLALVAANGQIRDDLDDPSGTPTGSATFAGEFREVARRVARTGDPLVVDDDRREAPALVPDSTVASTAIVPVGEFGVLACCATEPGAFPSRTVDLLGVLAANTDAALDRAHREERMREIRADLERSNADLEEFAYAASHDLREPLRMVTSYLELLVRRHGEDLDDDALELVEVAADGAERMKEMIRALLSYSRVETRGRDPVSTDLGDALEQATDNLAVAIDESDARIDRGELPTVLGDRHQLIQLFQNLVSNAIEYAGEDPPRVEVSATREGDHWRVAVTDDGVGIDPGAADRAFDMFERLGARGETEGTGMGLAICERIVDRHGGEIGIESTPGEGTTVWFTLPAAED